MYCSLSCYWQVHEELLHLVHFSLRRSHLQGTAQNLDTNPFGTAAQSQQSILPYLQRTESCETPICSVVSTDLNTHWEKGIWNSATQHCIGLKAPVSVYLNACSNIFCYLELDYQNGIKLENTKIYVKWNSYFLSCLNYDKKSPCAFCTFIAIAQCKEEKTITKIKSFPLLDSLVVLCLWTDWYPQLQLLTLKESGFVW